MPQPTQPSFQVCPEGGIARLDVKVIATSLSTWLMRTIESKICSSMADFLQ
jgi:hypothetical protein